MAISNRVISKSWVHSLLTKTSVEIALPFCSQALGREFMGEHGFECWVVAIVGHSGLELKSKSLKSSVFLNLVLVLKVACGLSP